MSITELDVQTLQLTYYFVKNWSYKLISTKDAQNEIWLGNPEHPSYPVIRISGTKVSSVFFDKSRILNIAQTVMKLFSRQADLLDIHISKELEEEKEESIQLVTINTEAISDPDLLTSFPDLNQAIQKVEDPQEEFQRITKLIEENDRQKMKAAKGKNRSTMPVATLVIIAICVVVFLAVNLLTYKFGNIEGASISSSILLGAYYKAFVVGLNEYWRFLTAGFVHIDLWHLLVNMMSLYNLGLLSEKVWGVKNYLLILFGSILFGSVFVFLGSGNSVSVGISGGIYGLLAAFIVYGIQTKILFQPVLRNQVLMIIFVNVLISFMPGVSLLAHLGGFVGGLLISIALTRNDSWKELRKNTVVAILVAIAFMLYRIPQKNDLDVVYFVTDAQVATMARELGLGFYSDHIQNQMSQYYLDHIEK